MLADKLKRAAQSVLMVDGDCLRAGLCRDLGFDETSRTENHRRAAELAKLAAQQGFFVIGSTMCPHQDHRSLLREVLGGHLQLIYLDASHEECAQRDTKGLYRQFAAGNLDHFSKDTFHEPLMTERDLTIRTGEKSLLDSYSELEAHFDLV